MHRFLSVCGPLWSRSQVKGQGHQIKIFDFMAYLDKYKAQGPERLQGSGSKTMGSRSKGSNKGSRQKQVDLHQRQVASFFYFTQHTSIGRGLFVKTCFEFL